jgi:hypothetical protein
MRTLQMLIVGLLAALVLGACVARGDTRAIAAGAGDAAPRLIMVRNHAVNPFTGEVMRKYRVANPFNTAKPLEDKPGWYEIQGWPAWRDADKACLAYHISPTDDKLEAVPLPPQAWTFDETTREIVKRDQDGTERWRFAMPGRRVQMGDGSWRDTNFRPGASVTRSGVHYLGYQKCLAAVSDETGNEL